MNPKNKAKEIIEKLTNIGSTSPKITALIVCEYCLNTSQYISHMPIGSCISQSTEYWNEVKQYIEKL